MLQPPAFSKSAAASFTEFRAISPKSLLEPVSGPNTPTASECSPPHGAARTADVVNAKIAIGPRQVERMELHRAVIRGIVYLGRAAPQYVGTPHLFASTDAYPPDASHRQSPMSIIGRFDDAHRLCRTVKSQASLR